MNSPVVYPSRIDGWLLAVLAVAAVTALGAALLVVWVAPPAAWPIALLTSALGAGLPLWLLVSTRYVLAEGELLVRCGPFAWRIRLVDITSITPSSNPLSSPALSLDRLRFDYGPGKSLMISPRDKEQFLRDIEAARRAAT